MDSKKGFRRSIARPGCQVVDRLERLSSVTRLTFVIALVASASAVGLALAWDFAFDDASPTPLVEGSVPRLTFAHPTGGTIVGPFPLLQGSQADLPAAAEIWVLARSVESGVAFASGPAVQTETVWQAPLLARDPGLYNIEVLLVEDAVTRQLLTESTNGAQVELLSPLAVRAVAQIRLLEATDAAVP